VSSRSDARQTSIIRPEEVFIPSGPHIVSRSFCASLHPSGHFISMSGRLPVLDQFLISFQVPRKGRSINRPDDVVSRLDVSLHGPDAQASYMEIACISSTVRTSAFMVRTLKALIWKLRAAKVQLVGPYGNAVRTRPYSRKNIV
jgi:hypothetical protein